MDYLFFDIECCDGNHICSFGYVIIDEKFRVLDKQDILINPEKTFKLGRAGFDPEIELAYKQEIFYSQKTFPEFYAGIKKLLNKKDRVLFGHNSGCDINFLLIACNRYDLKNINIKVYDTQKIYKLYKKDKNVCSLHKILDELKINVPKLEEHKSCDDAEMTMLIVKKMCQEENLTINDFINKYKIYVETTTGCINRKKAKMIRRERSKRYSLIKHNTQSNDDVKSAKRKVAIKSGGV